MPPPSHALRNRRSRSSSAATPQRSRSTRFVVRSGPSGPATRGWWCGAAGRSTGSWTSDTPRSLGKTVARLSALGWQVVVEASYSIYGERGSIDILAGHARTRVVLVVEVKSELMSMEELGRKLDEKTRLARRQLCRERFGWAPIGVGRLLVLPDLDSARRAAVRHAALLDRILSRVGQPCARGSRRGPERAPLCR